MYTIFKTGVLLPLLLWGMLFPKVSALLIDLHPGIQIAVICTGANMILLRLDPDGQPIEVENGGEAPCVLAETTLAATTDLPT